MTRAVLPLALIFSGAGPAFAAEGFTLSPGLWESRHIIVSGGKEDAVQSSRCIDDSDAGLTAPGIASLVDPAGTCEVLDRSFEADLGLVEILCTGGAISRGSLLVIPGTDEFAVYADVEFSGTRIGNGAIKVESRRTGACPAP
jgi:hypothetical protein